MAREPRNKGLARPLGCVRVVFLLVFFRSGSASTDARCAPPRSILRPGGQFDPTRIVIAALGGWLPTAGEKLLEKRFQNLLFAWPPDLAREMQILLVITRCQQS